MRNPIRPILAVALVGAGVYALYTAYDAYLSSGRAVVRLNLADGGGTKETTVWLDRAMNPLRVVLDVAYTRTHREPDPVLFDSRVTVSNAAGTPVWIGRAIHRDDKVDHNGQYGDDTLRKSLGDFDAPNAGKYDIAWSVTPRTVTVLRASLSMQAAAAPPDVNRIALGGILVAAGLLSLFLRRRGRAPRSRT